jgi:flagellar biosynthesis/type III secretory pathway ATPase
MNATHPCSTNRFDAALQRVRQTRVTETCGRVVQVIGLVIESEGPLAAVGEVCRIVSARHDGFTLAEVVGFRNHHLLLMPLGEMHGIHPGSEVIATGSAMRMPVGNALKGRVLDGLGKPLDGLGEIVAEHTVASGSARFFKQASRRSTLSCPAAAASAWEFSPAAASANRPCSA